MVYDFVQSRLQRNKKDEKLLVEYGSYGEYWSSSEARGPYGVGLWKYIRGGWNSFVGFLRYDVGDGTKLRFWHDLWQGETLLKERFPNLCFLERDSEATV
jgi:hypothetical protein